MDSLRPSYELKLSDPMMKELTDLLDKVKMERVLPEELSQAFSKTYQKYLSDIPEDVDPEPFVSKPFINMILKEEWTEQMSKPEYQRNYASRSKLPILKKKEEILNEILRQKVVIICGETGSGKTTQLPQFVLDYYIDNDRASECCIVCTQPRRISAISVARRVAKERAEELGNSVGYQVRLRKELPRKYASILYCTTGILLQKMKSDRFLRDISHIFLDEVHERDIETDFIMVVLKSVLEKRSNLRVILMSASVDAQVFSKYFGGCPIITIPGSCFEVKKFMLEDVIELLKYKPTISEARFTGRSQERLVLEEFYGTLSSKGYSSDTIRVVKAWDENLKSHDLIFVLIKHICRYESDGAILVFLPGWDEISSLLTSLENDLYFSSERFIIIPLHSKMGDIENNQVFEIPPAGVRKIILATNIAESSITIPDVVYVIDSGKANVTSYDIKRDLQMLRPTWITKANAIQRRGRAGRVREGKCYHLFTSGQEQLLAEFIVPEMLRMRLESLCLKIKILNLGNIKDIAAKAIDKPSVKALDNSIQYLQELDALDADEYLTPLGFHLARLPLDPGVGKLILLGAIFSCLDPILTIAASLSTDREFFKNPRDEKKKDEVKMIKKLFMKDLYSDHIMLTKVYEKFENALEHGVKEAKNFCNKMFLNFGTLQEVRALRQDLADHLHYTVKFLDSSTIKEDSFNENSDKTELLRAIISAGLYPNVVSLKCWPIALNTKNFLVFLHPKSPNSLRHHKFHWGVYHKIMETTKIFLYDLTWVNPFSLVLFGGQVQTNMVLDDIHLLVNGWIRFTCSKDLELLIKDLRIMLERVLVHKIQRPGPTDWEKEGRALQPIITLFCSPHLDLDVDSLSLEGMNFI